MKRQLRWYVRTMQSIGIVILLFISLWPRTGEAQKDTRTKWEELVQAARKEGRVTIASAASERYHQALVTGFQKAYPGIEVDRSGLQSREVLPRITQERKAGLFLWDIRIGGPTSMLVGLRPLGALAAIKPVLVLPEVLDDSKWDGGFDDGFADKEKRCCYMFSRYVSPTINVNRDVIPLGDFESAKDLLNPKFAGKIAWHDPRGEGAGLNSAMLFMMGYGEDFLRKLFSQQKIAYFQNRRQAAEAVVKGQYPIGVGLSIEIESLQDKGAGKNVRPIEEGKFGSVGNLSVGVGALALIDPAPHPNAAKVYLNWLLSREGQDAWFRGTDLNSRRVDVPGNPDNAPKPGNKYIVTATEDLVPQREHARKLAEQLLPR